VSDQFFWIVSRAAGTTALLFSSAAVGLGLAAAVKLRRGPELRVAHEALALATLVALSVHVVSLLGDTYVDFSALDLSVPLFSGYQRGWMTLGIVAGWSLFALGLSFYARGRIGARRWRTLHRFTALAWLAACAHSLGMGTDAGRTWFAIALGVVGLPALAALAARWSAPSAPRRTA
jgi:methionine sulfoxide reductase heme-binding subunit